MTPGQQVTPKDNGVEARWDDMLHHRTISNTLPTLLLCSCHGTAILPPFYKLVAAC